jgi:predicted amidohydrolase
MPEVLRVAAVQAPPRAIGADLAPFADEVGRLAEEGARLVVFPELHLFGPESHPDPERNAALDAAAVPLADPFVARLGAIAREHGVWLLPGSICERGDAGELFNTALLFSPAGDLVASYRKIFPWRPTEPYAPGDRFVVADVDGVRVGIDICFDAWFPEVTRHLAWMGAEVILNVVKTITPDREQEVVIARANAIVNQVFMVSVNCAGPVGRGRSVLVDPEGGVIAESPDAESAVLRADLELAHLARVRAEGTERSVFVWSHFQPGDAAIPLPLYAGRIDPATWPPASASSPDRPSHD